MKICRIALILVLQYLLIASPSAQASSQQSALFVPEALNVLSVDNVKQPHKFSLFSGGDTTLKLEPGLHRIVMEYEVFWEKSAEETEHLLSNPLQVSFRAEPGKQYFIKLPSLGLLDEARQYADKPVIKIIDRSTNRLVAADVAYSKANRSLFQFNQPTVTTSPARNSLPVASSRQTSRVTTGNMPLKMLEYWWEQASDKQRRHFLKSIKQ